MGRRITEYRKNISRFRSTQYCSDFFKSIGIAVALWIFYLISVLLLWNTRSSFQNQAILPAWTIAGFCILIIFTVVFWNHYYHAVIISALKIENIKEKYSLIDAEKMTDYITSLNIILDLIDSSLEKEYSNRLLQKQAELDAMQSQINPHFLYNTLDTIRGYAVMEDAPLTSDMVEVLSRLFRYMISRRKELVTLQQELSILYDYIKIQEYRINQHIVFIQNIAPELQIMNYQIPKLTIQPFIENAIKHGLKGISRDFVITLNIYNTQSRLIISISDNGCGMSPEQLRTLNQKLAANETSSVHENRDKKNGSGIALTNVNSRIKLLYGDSYGVIAYSTLGKGSEFQLSLPYHQSQE
jgi:two-component system sensor histidine kinase YesM